MVELRRAPATRPRSASSTSDPDRTSWTLIDVAQRASVGGEKRRSELLQRHACQRRHPRRDAVVAMAGMPSRVPIQVVPHVQELFGHDNFDREWLVQVDARQVDQNSVHATSRDVAVCSAIGRWHPSPDPSGVDRTGGSHPEVVRRQFQSRDILVNEGDDRGISRFEEHPSLPFTVRARSAERISSGVPER